MKQAFKYYFHSFNQKWKKPDQINNLLLGKWHAERVKGFNTLTSLKEAEFQVFSQNGEDGILQYLLSRVPIPEKVFVEFGVENYLESNTRFLVYNDHWTGVVLDSSARNVRFIRSDEVSWKYGVSAHRAFLTAENADSLLGGLLHRPEIGLLSIDIDGNDYWVWKAISTLNPRIVIIEFNNVFGPDYAISIPYQPNFDRYKAHYSGLYHGASLKACCQLAETKGYDFTGVNAQCMNAFFVRKDLSASLYKPSVSEAFHFNHICMSKDAKGTKTFLRGKERLKAIEHLPVIDINNNTRSFIKDLNYR
jgi:hypothetical protein